MTTISIKMYPKMVFLISLYASGEPFELNKQGIENPS